MPVPDGPAALPADQVRRSEAQPRPHRVEGDLRHGTVAEAARPESDGSDALLQARIKRERERVALQLAKDRDLGRLEATMARLDAEAEAVVVRPSRVPTAAEARAYLDHTRARGWDAAFDAGRHAIAEAAMSGSTSWG
ncbi:MAG TPA: hypothetical protein VLA23_06120 [Candidatus Limnocylindrales bacterium]|nr:hypothetical protein [Candidatus Limnocylindrales bacterium]